MSFVDLDVLAFHIGVHVAVCFNIDFILSLWLKEIPEYTNIFVILFLANVLAESYSTYLITVLLATGKIAFYQASVGTILLLNVPLSYLAFQWGYPPVSFLVVSIVLTFAASALRLFLLKKRFSFSITLFLRSVFLKTLLTILLVSALNFMLLNLRSLLPYGQPGRTPHCHRAGKKIPSPLTLHSRT